MCLNSTKVRLRGGGKYRVLGYDHPALAAFFGLSHANYLRIVEPVSYPPRRKITPPDVLAVMRDVMIETFGEDPALHPNPAEVVAA